MTSEDRNEWYRSAFSKDYLKIYAHRDVSEAQAAISNLVGRLELSPGALCLDLCCGFGRHLPPLDAAGLSVVGCDLSMDLLCNAKCGDGRLVRGNMASLPFVDSSFDAVFSFFTSFGYFEDDSENERVICEIARTLKPHGRLVMDFLNPGVVRSTLVSEDESQIDDLKLVQRRWIDDELNTVNKELIVSDVQGQRRYFEHVKLYETGHFDQFFRSAGLKSVTMLGDYSGMPYETSSNRQIHIVEKV